MQAAAIENLNDTLQEGHKIVLPGQTPEGEYILSVLLKRSYEIVPGQKCRRAETDFKLISGDVHYDGPMNSSVQFESDFVPFKVATDVVFNGKAYAPDGKPVERLKAAVEVGSYRKEIVVIGDRTCHYRAGRDPDVAGPKPFTTMDIRYERAYGGVDIYSDPTMPCLYPRNHLGRGFVIKNVREAVEGLLLPNIEDPVDTLTWGRFFTEHFMHWERQPMPQGFGWFAKFWQPRAGYAGVMPADRAVEQELRKAYAEVVPPAQRELYEQTQLPDMDFRFFNGASQGLALPYLKGDEEVRLTNVVPEGRLSFYLPGDQPSLGLDVGLGLQEPPVFLQTVMIRMEDKQVDLVWRAAASYPGPDWLPEMKKMEVFVQ